MMRSLLLSTLIATSMTVAGNAAAQNSNYLGYPNGNKASFPQLDEAISTDTRLYPSADTYTRVFVVEMFTDDALRNLTRS